VSPKKLNVVSNPTHQSTCPLERDGAAKLRRRRSSQQLADRAPVVGASLTAPEYERGALRILRWGSDERVVAVDRNGGSKAGACVKTCIDQPLRKSPDARAALMSAKDIGGAGVGRARVFRRRADEHDAVVERDGGSELIARRSRAGHKFFQLAPILVAAGVALENVGRAFAVGAGRSGQQDVALQCH